MKKILFFHHGSISVGAGLCALHILENIPQEEYEITVCLPNQAGDLKEKVRAKGIKVRTDIPKSYSYMHINGFYWNFFSPWHIKNLIDVHSYKKIAEFVIGEESPDIVIVNSMTLCWIGKIARKYAAKTICFHRETYCKGLFGLRTAWIKKTLNRDFDKIVFISNYDLKETGIEYDKYLRITDKVESRLYENLEREECRRELHLPNDRLVLYTGGASKLKGIFVLLKAARFLKTDAKIVILQCDKLEKKTTTRSIKCRIKQIMGVDILTKVWNYIERHNLQERVVLRGRTDCVEKYFVACDVVVFPSQSAHQARPIYEAGFAKRPIIVSDFPNTSEYLTDENGWVVSHKNAKAWAACIDMVLQGQTNVEKRVEENYIKVLKDNNYKDLKLEIEGVLEKV